MFRWFQGEWSKDTWYLESGYTRTITIGRWKNDDSHHGEWYVLISDVPWFHPADLTIEKVKTIVQIHLASMLKALAAQLSV